MGVTHLKRWQWMAIAVGLGLSMAYLQTAMGPEGLNYGGEHNSIGQEELERDLFHPPVNGHAVVKNLHVYPDGNQFLVKCSVLKRTHDRKDSWTTDYLSVMFPTAVPFEPVADLSETVNVGIHPAELARKTSKAPGVVKVNMWPNPVHSKFVGWNKIKDADLSDPGPDGQVGLTLRPANYRLIFVAPGASPTQIKGVWLKLNDHTLPPLLPAPHAGEAFVWETTIPKSAFVQGREQVLHAGRNDQPIGVREIRLIDPSFTFVDYLRDESAAHPTGSYAMSWSPSPKAVYLLWTSLSMLLIGVIWPTVLQMIYGKTTPAAAPAESDPETGTEPAPAMSSAPALATTVTTAATTGAATAATAPPLDSAPVPVPPAPPRPAQARRRDYRGVYYPVNRGRGDGFSLVELLVVIGIISMLIALLLPSLVKARQEAQRVQCMSNMRQVGMYLVNYSNQWNGAMFPPLLGASQPVTSRWPVFVFDPPVYNPPIMTCPSDQDPSYEHSYIMNSHLTEHHVTYSNTQVFGVTPSEVIVMGEKTTSSDDYYMDADAGDYTTKVDFYKHGPNKGSNYLYLDLHVETDMPTIVQSDLDPWDPAGYVSTITTTE